MKNKEILIRLYKNYTSKFLKRILLAGLFSILVAGSTSAIAYLLDPAIKKIFVDKDQTLIYLIPLAIILAFSMKGFSLYFAKVNMIHVAENVKKNIQSDMMDSLIKADTKVIDSKHTGKMVSNLIVDTGVIVNLVSVVLLNLFKDTLTLFGLLFVMFYQNWKLSLIAIIMIPFASYTAQKLGKKIGKVSTIGMESSGFLNTHLVEIFKNHKLMKIFQRENYERDRINDKLEKVKNAAKKISTIFVRVSPIMETLTGIMIALLIYYSGKLIIKGEIDINNFFSFLAAMMLAYQPVRSLATLNMGIQTGLSAARRILPVIDQKIDIQDNIDCKDLNIKNGEINFNDVCFKYDLNNENLNILDKININESFDQKLICNYALAYLWNNDLEKSSNLFKISEKISQVPPNIKTLLNMKDKKVLQSLVKHEYEQICHIDSDIDGIRNMKITQDYFNDLERINNMNSNEYKEVDLKFISTLHKIKYNKPAKTKPPYLNENLNHQNIQLEYTKSQPEICIVDNILSESFLDDLNIFFRCANIFKRPYPRGYVGTFLGTGMSNKPILQFSKDLT